MSKRKGKGREFKITGIFKEKWKIKEVNPPFVIFETEKGITIPIPISKNRTLWKRGIGKTFEVCPDLNLPIIHIHNIKDIERELRKIGMDREELIEEITKEISERKKEVSVIEEQLTKDKDKIKELIEERDKLKTRGVSEGKGFNKRVKQILAKEEWTVDGVDKSTIEGQILIRIRPLDKSLGKLFLRPIEELPFWRRMIGRGISLKGLEEKDFATKDFAKNKDTTDELKRRLEERYG